MYETMTDLLIDMSMYGTIWWL